MTFIYHLIIDARKSDYFRWSFDVFSVLLTDGLGRMEVYIVSFGYFIAYIKDDR